MSSHQKDIEDRWLVYKNYNHIPSVKVSKYSFDEIEKIFSRIELNYNYNCKIRISYDRYFPEISNCVILNCANPDAPNAGYRINHKVTQEGQLFHDTDIFSSYIGDFYPFRFNKELLYVENVTFHNNDDLQFDPYYLRTNDVIFAASKKTKNKFETEKIKNDLERIIESIFKITYIKKKKKLYLWPIGCGVFNNNPRTISSIFAKNIRKYNYHFNEIVIIIYDKNHKDKIFNDSLIDELNFNKLNYRIN